MSEFKRRRRTLQERPEGERRQFIAGTVPYCAWCNGPITVSNIACSDEDGYHTCLECFTAFDADGTYDHRGDARYE